MTKEKMFSISSERQQVLRKNTTLNNESEVLIKDEQKKQKMTEDEENLKKTRQEMGFDPKNLLLSDKEAESKYIGERYEYSAESDEQKIFILGIKHTDQIDKVQDFEKILAEYNPDLVLTEIPESLEIFFPSKTPEEINNMQQEEVITKEEQKFFTWLAQKTKKETSSWDITQTEVIKKTLNTCIEDDHQKFKKDDVIIWLATYGMRKLYEADGGKNIQKLKTGDELYKELYNLITFACPGIEKDEDMNLDLSKENISKLIQKKTGQSLDVFADQAHDDNFRSADQELVTEISDPRQNAFSAEMNITRDYNAIDVIQKAKKEGKKRILVTAGLSHAVRWEKAIKQIY